MMSIKVLGLGPTFRRAALNPRLALRNQVVLRNGIGRRLIQTESLSPSASEGILNKQRLSRPMSPHLTIYQPQLTSVVSIFNRFAGAGLGVLLYGFGLAYLVAPTTFDSVHLLTFIHELPEVVKLGGKFILAAPFSLHFFNGLRHLAWDAGKLMSLKGVYTGGYVVLGAATASTVYLTFF
ncbi:SDH3 putative [Agaricus bisporus var. burnettii JB137-S8]|uniref:SDH3 putative n=1 Tax=Agaricus bisporus var. burnettii (strain JB137-S8 / ATCC MYA-4627 / FGSC 10392) TaxID=597362 RepID=K5Y7U1_AGABU|nr:SDH3 putative [Agaricus bisporus var. burnettii JB137-S8]EKM84350.1 SDH3 putative [Agaricus bisporus var. burnettii JB137-S8]